MNIRQYVYEVKQEGMERSETSTEDALRKPDIFFPSSSNWLFAFPCLGALLMYLRIYTNYMSSIVML